jgi:hypothetical protein
MRVRIQRNLGETALIEASTVVIEDAFGNPIAVAYERSPGVTVASIAQQPDFDEILRMIGFGSTVYVVTSEPKALPAVQFK